MNKFSKFYHFVAEHPLIMAAGVAALIHSVWALDVLFAGVETDFSADPLNAIFRKFVALLIAIAIDVGQIVTSSEIKKGQRYKSKYFTFLSFAVATYLLQFYYMIHHVPNIALAGGVRPEWDANIQWLDDALVWIVPAFLPLSTLFYTFSQQKSTEEEDKLVRIKSDYVAEMDRMTAEFRAYEKRIVEKHDIEIEKIILEKQQVQLQLEDVKRPQIAAPALENSASVKAQIYVECPECDFKRGYEDEVKATNGLRSHKPYCTHSKVKQEVSVE